MAYKRRTKTGSDGVKRTTTHNTKTGFTHSYSSAKKGASYRQTHTLKNGKWTTTETIRGADGYVTRRKLGAASKSTKSSSSKSRPVKWWTSPKRQRTAKSNSLADKIIKWMFIIFFGVPLGITFLISFLKSLFGG